ncbi:T9SS type B sorting domain-containing protein [Aureisphaera galaxeae]|uniref:T9SS type B sorting domain-containing protein n=1 Tax=Aureisphaera galaxeae TaxID=1538023 RepID=UPI002351019C|nr:T9SS type B sorting domain-containing protein [Aureisphaera galaxeae]MDC8005189.1 T9SS type B sorting domain-containing protein [Aureisphaera galaxeae]
MAQECPDLLDPTDGAVDVPVTTSISWESVVGVSGYRISLGTSPGGFEIVNNQNVGNATTFTPPLGLPESTEVFVTITLFFFNQDDIECPSQSFRTEDVTSIPVCTELTSPQDGDVDVPRTTNLFWSYAPLATGYRIRIGTSPGAGDIVNNQDVGNVLSFNPPGDLPIGVPIYVQITPYNENGNATGCPEESFITADLGDPPGCTQLISPLDGATNVELSPLLEWEPVPGATGYIVYLGRTPFENDVLDGTIFFTNATFVLNFEANNTYFIRIIPFNKAGPAQGCAQESFATILGCGPFIDDDTGEIIYLNPEIDFPDQISICENELPTRITTTDEADGFRWYQIGPSGNETLISEAPSVNISETGTYIYEAYTVVNQDGVIVECPTSKEFTVVSSSTARIDDIDIELVGQRFNITVLASGIGDYEYSLLDSVGGYSDNNTFTNLEAGTYTVYVRDKNGCGVVEETFELRLRPPGFPQFFTPNGDGFNDLWQYIPPKENPLNIRYIFIYDRMGKLMIIIKPDSEGWNGMYRGNPLPSSEYWYRAQLWDGTQIRGHFSLIR